MARCSLLLFFLALAVAACSSAPGVRSVLPLSTDALGVRSRPLETTQHLSFSGLSKHIRLRKKVWNPIPLPSGFSGAFYLGAASSVKPGTNAYVVTTSSDPVEPALPAAAKPLFYAAISVGAPAEFAKGTTWRFTLPKSYQTKIPSYVGVYDPSNPTLGWQLAYSSKGSISHSVLTVSTTEATMLAPTLRYVFVLYASRSRVAPEPITNYGLVGTMKQNYTFAFPSAPYPSSSPVPPLSVSETVKQIYSVRSTQPPGPVPTAPPSAVAIDVHLTEIDTGATQTTVSSGDSYLYTANSVTYALGSIAYLFPPGAQNADTTTIVYNEPQPVSVAPQSTPTSWPLASPAETIDQVFAGGATYHRVMNDNGTYKETGSVPQPQGPPQVTTIKQQADGAGSYENSQAFWNGICAYAFQTPDPHGHVPIHEYTDYSSSQSCGNDYSTIDASTWYPSPPPSVITPSPAPALVLLAKSAAVTASATTPSRCKKTSGTAATLVTQTTWQLDTVVGFADFEQIRTYRNAQGAAICMLLSDTLQNYYDWLGNNPVSQYYPIFTKTGQPLWTVVTTEALWSPSGASAANAGFPVGDAARLHFRAQIERLKKVLLMGGLRT